MGLSTLENDQAVSYDLEEKEGGKFAAVNLQLIIEQTKENHE